MRPTNSAKPPGNGSSSVPGHRRSDLAGLTLPVTSFMNALDTNIWIYSHDARDEGKRQKAQELIANPFSQL